MNPVNEQTTIANFNKIQKTLWATFSFTICLILFVAHQPHKAEGNAAIGEFFPFIAFGIAVISYLLFRWSRSDKCIASSINAKEGTLATTLQSRQAFFIFTLALNEVIAILGFVYAFTSGDPALMYPYAIAALGLNIIMFPQPVKIA